MSAIPWGLLACALVVLRTVLVGHAPDEADVVIAALALPLWWRFGSARPLDLAIGAVLLGALTSVAGSRAPWISLLSLSLVAGTGACLAVGSAVPLRRGVWCGLALGGAVHGLLCAAQRFVLWPDALARRDELELMPSIVATMSAMRPIGLSISPDLGAAVGMAGVVGALALAVDSTVALRQRQLAGLLAACSALAPLLSRSFGAALAVGAGVVVVVLLSRSLRALLVLGVCVLVTGAAALGGRGVAALALSSHERLANWSIAWHAFVDAPVLGHGLMRFAPAYLERRGPDENVTRYAHSLPLQWLVETGIVGGTGLVVGVVILLRLLRQPMTTQRLVVVGGAVAVWSRGLIDYDFHVGQTAMLGAFVLGSALTPAAVIQRSRVAVVAVAAVVVVVAVALLLRALSSSTVLRVDPEAALAAVSAGAPAEPTLMPFVNEVAPAALLVAQERLAHDDVAGALLLLDKVQKRDPGNVAAVRLRVALAQAGHGDLNAALAAAARWHAVVDQPPGGS